ncbi:monogalactosyldiacylglycerol synthase [Pseudonocardia endophytica]|uniref:Monogalactosyldiacylglycerol synthase n=1 Tax=Pseudonocardia endophytica TaxID=401976 RepID=A0A4R1HEH6_PSEEN|nr:monogalactosyldiacylglycerol synthase [Pseudonocardia endophytica]
MLSAPVGEGHVAAARALAARMRARWPDTHVREVESTGGAGRDRLLAAAWATVMRHAPALYGIGYDALVGAPWFARLCKSVAGRRLARTLDPLLRAERPDLVVSTYPMTTGGLARLRGRGRLDAYTVAVVTDVAVHPFWVWADVDETWTLLESSRRQAVATERGADVRVAAPAVGPDVHRRDRAAARRATGLDPDAFLVLLSGGSLAFGGLETLADAVLDAGDGVGAVVLCGRDERLRTRLAARGQGRLRALGWTDRVPELLSAVDLTLTTAGGMIATESLAAGTPVLFAAPVPGHGRAGARMTAEAGLALVCGTTDEVAAAVRLLRDDRDTRAALAGAAAEFAARDPDAELDALAGRIALRRTG